MMRRTPFRRTLATTTVKSEANREQRIAERALRAINSVVPRAANMGLPPTAAAPIPKAAPVRSEPYRRVVATLPCAICGVHGYSQAAHANQGKGMGMKACDLTCFPACGPRPGMQGCHTALDQGALFMKAVRREMEPIWAADTMRRLWEMGLIPDSLRNQVASLIDKAQ